MAQRLGPRLLERVPQVDVVAGPDGYRGLPELIARARAGDRAADVLFRAWEHYEDVPVRPVSAAAGSAFVTVQRGCDYRCTFCIVPMTRGPERSRKLGDVVREVAGLAAMAETRAVCEHVHLPAQSGSSRTLKRMLRRYDRARYLEVVAALRAAVPGIALTTDLIVGFPGETEEDFQETVSLVEAAAFDDAYTFKFSPREGTPAVRLKDPVPDGVAGERLARLIATVRGMAARKNAGLVGTTHEVLVEGQAKRGGLLQARTRTNKVALLAGPAAWIGSYRTVRLTGTTGSTFTARECALVG